MVLTAAIPAIGAMRSGAGRGALAGGGRGQRRRVGHEDGQLRIGAESLVETGDRVAATAPALLARDVEAIEFVEKVGGYGAVEWGMG
jgi:hypothetical protein